MIFDMLSRGWRDFFARLDGPLHFRFFLQPTVAAIIAIFAGLSDAKAGRPAYLWTAFVNPGDRRVLLEGGWKDIRNVFLLAVILDVGYQIVVQHSIYLFELLFTTVLLAIVPYVLLRGPSNRLVRMCFWKNRNASPAPASPHESKSSSQS